MSMVVTTALRFGIVLLIAAVFFRIFGFGIGGDKKPNSPNPSTAGVTAAGVEELATEFTTSVGEATQGTVQGTARFVGKGPNEPNTTAERIDAAGGFDRTVGPTDPRFRGFFD